MMTSGRDESLGMDLSHAGDLPEAESQRGAAEAPSAFVVLSGMAVSAMHGRDAYATLKIFQRAIPLAFVHVDRPDVDAVLLGVAHDLGRRVESHRLAVQQCAREHGGMVPLNP